LIRFRIRSWGSSNQPVEGRVLSLSKGAVLSLSKGAVPSLSKGSALIASQLDRRPQLGRWPLARRSGLQRERTMIGTDQHWIIGGCGPTPRGRPSVTPSWAGSGDRGQTSRRSPAPIADWRGWTRHGMPRTSSRPIRPTRTAPAGRTCRTGRLRIGPPTPHGSAKSRLSPIPISLRWSTRKDPRQRLAGLLAC
jgi:hypothetical protein